MGISKAKNTDTIYVSDNLQQKVDEIKNYSITVLDAPAGYGKSTMLKKFFTNECRSNYIITCKNSDKETFFQEFCDVIKCIDYEIGENLLGFGYPKTQKEFEKFHNILTELSLDEEIYIIIDNYHYIGSLELDEYLLGMNDEYDPNLKIIISTQGITSTYMYEQTATRHFWYIQKSDFELQELDIKKFFNQCGVLIDTPNIKKLYSFSEGWMSAIYLQMIHYKEKREIDESLSIDLLIEKALWKYLTESEKKILMYSCIFNKFSVRQLKFIVGEEDGKQVEKLLTTCAFIKYDSHDKTFYHNGILRRYLLDRYQNIDINEQQKILVRAGKWFVDNKEYFEAIKKFHLVDDYEDMYKIRLVSMDLHPYAISENKLLFTDIVTKCPYDIKMNNLPFLFVICCILISYSENDILNQVIDEIKDYLSNSKLDKKEVDNALGELYLIEAISKYNDISEMYKYITKSYDLLKKSSNLLGGEEPWTFGSASVLCLYYNETGKLWDMINYFTDNVNTYYKLTNGHGKGAEAIMKAEALFNTGDIASSEILCHKAIYMADSRKQYCIKLASLTLLGKIAIFNGDADSLKDIINSIEELRVIKDNSKRSKVDNRELIDLCLATLYVALDNEKEIASWLKDAREIENRTFLQAMGYVDIIYGKYLILTGKYTKLLGLSGQFIGIASKYPQVLTRIYTYIYIAIANEKLNNYDKADKMLKISLDYAKEDGIYMPYVENWKYIKNIFSRMAVKDYKKDIKIIEKFSKTYEKNIGLVKKSTLSDVNYGLTNRELDVARLAANRYTNKEIASKLFIAESTVKSNLKIVFSKLNISSRTELSDFFNNPPEK